MNKIALGTVQFGQDYGIANKNGQVKIEEISSILEFALTNGINTLDTAFGYGESEKKLGIAGIKGWKVISKLPHLPNHRIDIDGWVKHTTKISLQLLKTEKLYGLLLHRPLDLLSGSGDNLYKSLVLAAILVIEFFLILLIAISVICCKPSNAIELFILSFIAKL